MHNAKADAVKQQQTAKCKIAALGANFTVQMLNSSSTAAAMGICEHLKLQYMIMKRKGRYNLRMGVLQTPHTGFWTRFLKFGDEMDVSHFLSMS